MLPSAVARWSDCRRPGRARRRGPARAPGLILTRALAYDGNLKTRAGADLLIAVLGKPGNAASDELASTMGKAFRGLGNVKVQGLAVRATQLAYKDAAGLAAAIESPGHRRPVRLPRGWTPS